MKKVILTLLIILLAVCFTACGSSKSEGKTLTWAQPDNYTFAVDVSSYTGDQIPAGKYQIYETVKDGTVPVVYDVYVSKTEHAKLDELTDAESVGSVGGTDNEKLNLDLASGSYVYIKYNKVTGEQGSYITIEPAK